MNFACEGKVACQNFAHLMDRMSKDPDQMAHCNALF
ncbi:hypothetical protein T02_9242 [Trichinella nativa]|uniref:Uncharacterized protein n=1 Tax=Trichinella nativa TaxID=6335 RepID=A0A0V1LI05_9BILA|nr:hypothetical protein T02_9242 [Trichinella nativa]